MKYPLLIAIITFSICTETVGQLNVAEVNSIEVEVNKHNQAYYRHKIKKDETLFSLSRFFKVSLNDLLLINKMRRGDTVPLGATIIIPIVTKNIRTVREPQNDDWVPMYYTVRPKETLHKISSVYFPQKIDDLIVRNNISGFSLPRGKKLLIGWWGDETEVKKQVDRSFAEKLKTKLKKRLEDQKVAEAAEQAKINEEKEVQEDEEMIKELDDLLAELETEIEDQEQDTIEVVERQINYRTGLAFWDKSGHDRENLFVMHNAAKANSYIRLRYPVTGQEVTAQVICPIPKGIYGEDIDLVITPAVATALGALDSRFEIQMDFY